MLIFNAKLHYFTIFVKQIKVIAVASYLQIENISKSYGPKVLFGHIGFNINEGDKIALIAPNGTGKSTLLRILAGNDKSDSGGKITFLKHIRIAFLEQEFEHDPEKDIFTQVLDSSKKFTDGLDDDAMFAYELRIKKFLTSFGLQEGSLMKNLSGGEVKRVALTVMLASEADFFIMDEPTNHLDIESKEVLERAIAEYDGTLLMVSHDRYFINKLATRIFELTPNGLATFEGGYSYYLEKKAQRLNAAAKKEKNEAAAQEHKAEKNDRAELRKQRAKLGQIERDIEKAEARKKEIEKLLSMPENAADYKKLQELTEENDRIDESLEALYEEWGQLSE